jgi:WD40 repeat protein
MYPAPYILGAARWLLEQAGGKIFTIVTDRLAVKMGFKSEQLTTSQARVLLDDYLQHLEDRLVQRIIARLDEERLVILKSAIYQLKKSSNMKLKEAVLGNALNSFSHIINIPVQGDTGGFSNTELRSIAFLGIAAIHMSLLDSDFIVAENIAEAIYADSSTTEKWLGKELVQELLRKNPMPSSVFSQPTIANPPLSPTAIASRIHPTQGTILWTYHNASRLEPTRIAWPHQLIIYGSQGARILDAMTGSVLVSHTIHKQQKIPDNIYARWWSQDGSLFAYYDYGTKIVDASTGQTLITISSIPKNDRSEWSPRGTHIASYAHNECNVTSVTTGEKIISYQGHILAHQGRFVKKQPNQLPLVLGPFAWSPDETRIASHEKYYPTYRGSRQGTWLVTIHIWEALTGKTLTILDFGTEKSNDEFISLAGHGIRWSPDAENIAHYEGKSVQVANTNTQKLLASRSFSAGTGPKHGVVDVHWSPNGTHLAVIMGDIYEGANIYTWNFTNNAITLLRLRPKHPKLEWSPDGTQLAVCCHDSVSLWNITTGHHIYTHNSHTYNQDRPDTFLRAIAWSPNGKQIASASENDVIIWQAA